MRKQFAWRGRVSACAVVSGVIASIATITVLATSSPAAQPMAPGSAAASVLSSLPATDRPTQTLRSVTSEERDSLQVAQVIAANSNAQWMNVVTPKAQLVDGDSGIETALYSNWLGEIAVSATQGQLLQSDSSGLAGATIDASNATNTGTGNMSNGDIVSDGSVVVASPEGEYVLPATGLNDKDIIDGIESRATTIGVTILGERVLTLGDWKAVAIKAQASSDAIDTEKSWSQIAQTLLPTGLCDAVVGYYLALEDADGSLVHISTTGYLAGVTHTYISPDVVAISPSNPVVALP